jgi:large subunit ribosomal protein L30
MTKEKNIEKENNKKLKVTLVKSTAKKIKSHKACASGLGLSRIRQTVELQDTPEIRGMINTIHYLVKVEKN